VLQCVVVCCSVLQCVAVCCSVLQCVAVCCSVLQCGCEWVTSHTNESCHTEWVMWHICMGHVTIWSRNTRVQVYMMESCRTWMRHVTREWGLSTIIGHITFHIEMSHLFDISQKYHRWMRHVTHEIFLRHIYICIPQKHISLFLKQIPRNITNSQKYQ